MANTEVYDIAVDLLACAVDGLQETPLGPPVRQAVYVGDMAAWDNCCDGQVTVCVTRVYASTIFPDDDLSAVRCGSPFTAINVDIEVVRCGPTFDNQGNPPSESALNAAAFTAHVDARAVRTAVRCCLYENRRLLDSIERGQIFLNDGACLGSRLSMTVGMRNG